MKWLNPALHKPELNLGSGDISEQVLAMYSSPWHRNHNNPPYPAVATYSKEGVWRDEEWNPREVVGWLPIPKFDEKEIV